jgi:hypothetical protein
MKASLAGGDKAAANTAFDSMKVIKGQIDGISSGGAVAAPAVSPAHLALPPLLPPGL